VSGPLRLRPDGLATGPQDPVPGPPARRPGSIRRTTSIDMRRGAPGDEQEVLGVGRDLLTLADGTTQVVDAARVAATVDRMGIVTSFASDPPVPALDGLIGEPVRSGLRRRVDALAGEHRERATVLHQILDDLPMAALISGYGASREVPDFTMPPESAAGMTDLCSGWRAGATMLGHLETTGLFPIPLGPDAPPLTDADDPLGWHDLPELQRRSIRRTRRLDVVLADGVAEVDVHYRDSHLGPGDEVEDVLHEYRLAVTVDPVSLEVRSASADAHVLPWPECPGALASAERVVGEPVTGLRPLVALQFTGTSTCTHLNDSLRSLAGVQSLVAALR